MEPIVFGRRVGTGVRLAGAHLRGLARASAAQPASSAAAPPQASRGVPGPSRFAGGGTAGPVSAAVKARAIENKTRAVGQASKRFGEAIWGPFVHASSVLWLEVTGLFFGIFALFFAQSVYRMRAEYRSGPEHGKFLVYAGLMVLFVYFTLSSFFRSYRKGRRGGRR